MTPDQITAEAQSVQNLLEEGWALARMTAGYSDSPDDERLLANVVLNLGQTNGYLRALLTVQSELLNALIPLADKAGTLMASPLAKTAGKLGGLLRG